MKIYIFENINGREELRVKAFDMDLALEAIKHTVKFPNDWRYKEVARTNQTKLFPYLKSI